MYLVEITEYTDYDLIGKVVGKVAFPSNKAKPRSLDLVSV